MFHYSFTREIHGRNWTVDITPDKIHFESGIHPHWHIMRDGTVMWDRFGSALQTKNMPRVRALRIAALGFKALREVQGGLFSNATRVLYADTSAEGGLSRT